MARSAASFQPGKSGNPAGRPKGSKGLKLNKAQVTALIASGETALDNKQMVALARSHCPAAFQTLVECLRDPRHRVAAATALLDRGYGKPKQEISGDAERPVAIAFSWAPAQDSNHAVDTASDTHTTIDANDAALKIVWDRDGTDGE